MKKFLLSATLLSTLTAGAVTHTISTTGSFTFTPATVNANVGDTIEFVIGGSHTATEVSSTTWAANGNTPLGGGFNFSSGTHTLVLTAAGTRYYVCSPHATMGMKGQINVTGGTGTNDLSREMSISAYPNPATDYIQLNVTGSDNNTVNIDVMNLLGTKVLDLGGKQTLSNGVKKIDVSALPRGVYFLNVAIDNKTKSIRFVKE